jgi:hypothetical protein
VGTLLDVAAVALAILVSGSLALLAWTLGVTARKAAGGARRRVVQARADLAWAERQMGSDAARLRELLRDLAARTRLDPKYE